MGIKALKAIDLFSGIGGIKLGLQQAGFDVIYSNDIDRYCKQTFEANFNEKMDCRDISDIKSNEIPDHDLLAAGFPCQPFSIAGHKMGFQDPRGSMFFELVRIIKNKQPKAFLLENVKHLEGHDGGNTFSKMMNILHDDLGYTVFFKVLNSKDYGLAQNRQRIYIVGFKNKVDFKFPNPISDDGIKLKDILENEPIDKNYFLSQKYYEGLVKHKERHAAKGSGFGFEILDLNGTSHALVVGNMGRERNLVQDLPRVGFYNEGMDKAKARNSLGIRKLTIRECARLQGLPDTFVFPVSRTQTYKQIGNSVSVPLIKLIAVNIFKWLQSEDKYVKDTEKADNYNKSYLTP